MLALPYQTWAVRGRPPEREAFGPVLFHRLFSYLSRPNEVATMLQKKPALVKLFLTVGLVTIYNPTVVLPSLHSCSCNKHVFGNMRTPAVSVPWLLFI